MSSRLRDVMDQITSSSSMESICEKEKEEVLAFDGLHVLGTERHESRRIDNQLRGRSGRQGDPGVSQFFLSLEDDLMRLFGSDRIGRVMERLGLPEDQPIEHSMISKSIETAQHQVESQNFEIRKHVLEYCDPVGDGKAYERVAKIVGNLVVFVCVSCISHRHGHILETAEVCRT